MGTLCHPPGKPVQGNGGLETLGQGRLGSPKEDSLTQEF